MLTGIVAAFLARGAPAFAATAAAAWVHGAAADAVREVTGPTGLVARDLVGAIAPTLLALDRVFEQTGRRQMGDDNAVSTIMTTNVVTLSPEQSVAEAADVLSERAIGAAPVVDESGTVVGLLRDEDLLLTESNLHVPTTIEFLGAELIWPPSMHRYEAELRRAAASKVSELMSTDFATVAPNDTIESWPR